LILKGSHFYFSERAQAKMGKGVREEDLVSGRGGGPPSIRGLAGSESSSRVLWDERKKELYDRRGKDGEKGLSKNQFKSIEERACRRGGGTGKKRGRGKNVSRENSGTFGRRHVDLVPGNNAQTRREEVVIIHHVPGKAIHFFPTKTEARG